MASEEETLSTCRNIDFIDSNPGVSTATAGAGGFIGRFISGKVSERANGGSSWGGDPGWQRGGTLGRAMQGMETMGTCPSPRPLRTSFPQGDLHALGRILEIG